MLPFLNIQKQLALLLGRGSLEMRRSPWKSREKNNPEDTDRWAVETGCLHQLFKGMQIFWALASPRLV